MQINSQTKNTNKKSFSNIQINQTLLPQNNLNLHYIQNNSNPKQINKLFKNYEPEINLSQLSNIIHNGLQAQRYSKNNQKILHILSQYEKKQLELQIQLIKQIQLLINIKINQINHQNICINIQYFQNQIQSLKKQIFQIQKQQINNNNNINNNQIKINSQNTNKLPKQNNYHFTKLSNGKITISKLNNPKSTQNLFQSKIKNKHYQSSTTQSSTNQEQSLSENLKNSKISILKQRILIIKQDISQKIKFSSKIQQSISSEINNMKIQSELLDEEINKSFGYSKNIPSITPNPRMTNFPNQYQVQNNYSKKSKSSLSSPVDKTSPRSKNRFYRPSIFIKSKESSQTSPKLETKFSDLKYRSQSPFSYFHQEKSQTKCIKIHQKANQYRQSCFDYYGKQNRNNFQLKNMKRDKYFQKCYPFAQQKN